MNRFFRFGQKWCAGSNVLREEGPSTHQRIDRTMQGDCGHRLSPVPGRCIRMADFGWARPNRAVSRAVYRKFAAGHLKLGAEREVRSSPWGFSALTASRLNALRVQKKPMTVGVRLRAGRAMRSERASAMNVHTAVVGLKEWWAGLHPAERESEFTAAGRRAGLPNEFHPKFELAEHGGSKSQLRSIRSLHWPAKPSPLKRPTQSFEIRIHIHGTIC
jgi:hypothetical protein